MGQKIKSDQYFSALRASRDNPTALILDDGSVFTGFGFGAAVANTGEVCFNTSMTGYQKFSPTLHMPDKLLPLLFRTSGMWVSTIRILKQTRLRLWG